jgi:transcriptional regulator with XRE-family HTH domain
MKNIRRTLLVASGNRLKEIRKTLDLSTIEMARKLGIIRTAYYKNESGETLPGLTSLLRMKKDLDISMDWFLFGIGPMFYMDKESGMQTAADNKNEILSLVNLMPDVKELWNQMAQDPLLRHELMVYYYKYKENKENKTSNEIEPEPEKEPA